MTAKTRKWQALIAFLLLLLSLSCIIPLWLVVSISFTDEAAIVKNGYSLIPSQFSTDAYATIFSGGKQVWRSYGISVFITIAGTIAHVAVTGMAGYSLANPSVRYRNGLAMFFFITMVFNWRYGSLVHDMQNLWLHGKHLGAAHSQPGFQSI